MAIEASSMLAIVYLFCWNALLPGVAEQLNEFVGAIPVYGDVNDILETSMSRMKVLHLLH